MVDSCACFVETVRQFRLCFELIAELANQVLFSSDTCLVSVVKPQV